MTTTSRQFGSPRPGVGEPLRVRAQARGGRMDRWDSPRRPGGPRAFTLIEMLVVVGIIALMATLTLPAYNRMVTEQRRLAAGSAIRSAIRIAQGHAARNQRVAGVRVQMAATTEDNWWQRRQVLVLIEHDPAHPDDPTRFRAVPNTKTLNLPEGYALVVEDLDWNRDGLTDADDFDAEVKLLDAATFNVVFAPSGRLVVRNVVVYARDNDAVLINMSDPSESDIDAFLPDDGSDTVAWCHEASSVAGFRVVELAALGDIATSGQAAANQGAARADYFNEQTTLLINAYTGAVIDTEELDADLIPQN